MRTTILLLLLIAFVGVSTSTAQNRFSRVVTDASLWDPVNISSSTECEGSASECAVKMLDEQNIDVGESPLFSVYRLGEVNEKSVTVVFVSHKVNDDDSVAGMLYRIELSLSDVEDRSFSLGAIGRMYKCMRGRKGWSKRPCL